MGKITISTLEKQKAAGEKFVCITAYDATFARVISEAGAEAILVGDSLGMVLQGHDSTIPVAIEHMAYHTECVCRAQPQSLVIADMPFMTYPTAQQAMDNATRLMQAGAQMVKMEGGTWLSDTISMLVERGIPVCAHLGLTPQSVHTFGGFKVQGRSPKEAKSILADAVEIQDAGASLLVLHDLLGLSAHTARFVHNFMDGQSTIQGGIRAFVEAVKVGQYPREEHSYS